MLLKPYFVVGAIICAFLSSESLNAAPKTVIDNTVTKLAIAAAPMPASHIEKLYRNKTWSWDQGGGFFSADKGKTDLLWPNAYKFSASMHQKRNWSYAEGLWRATDDGKLCIKASWSSRANPSRSGAITCFLHREKNGVVYQKPSIGGEWYIFRHNPEKTDDEARKLHHGDHITKEVARLKAKGS